jgi:hypothetical protein
VQGGETTKAQELVVEVVGQKIDALVGGSTQAKDQKRVIVYRLL